MTPLSVFFATAMDGISRSRIEHLFRWVENELERIGLVLSNPLSEAPDFALQQRPQDAEERRIVQHDLEKLKLSDLCLVDMSLRGHVYIGCICEIVYAYQWRKPIVVCIGDNDLETRMWLKYHTSYICRDFDAAFAFLRARAEAGRPDV